MKREVPFFAGMNPLYSSKVSEFSVFFSPDKFTFPKNNSLDVIFAEFNIILMVMLIISSTHQFEHILG